MEWHALLDGALGVLIMVGLVGGVLYQHEIEVLLRRLAQRVLPREEHPAGPPLECIVRDARRLRGVMLSCSPGTPMARRVAVCRAYDDLLADACRALAVPDTLTGLPLTIERDVERLRVEHALAEAGLSLGA